MFDDASLDKAKFNLIATGSLKDLAMYIDKDKLAVDAGELSAEETSIAQRLAVDLGNGVVLPQELLEAYYMYMTRAAGSKAEAKDQVGNRQAPRIFKELSAVLGQPAESEERRTGMFNICDQKARFFTEETYRVEMLLDFVKTPFNDGMVKLHSSLMEQSISWEKMRNNYYRKED